MVGVGPRRFGCFLNGCCYGQLVCTACCVYPVHFPLAAPPRYALSDAGDQTAAGFTFALQQPEEGARVGQVEPWSAAARRGLKANDIVTRADDQIILQGGRAVRVLGQLCLVATREERPKTRRGAPRLADARQELDFRPRTIGLHPTQLYETISMARSCFSC